MDSHKIFVPANRRVEKHHSRVYRRNVQHIHPPKRGTRFVTARHKFPLPNSLLNRQVISGPRLCIFFNSCTASALIVSGVKSFHMVASKFESRMCWTAELSLLACFCTALTLDMNCCHASSMRVSMYKPQQNNLQQKKAACLTHHDVVMVKFSSVAMSICNKSLCAPCITGKAPIQDNGQESNPAI